MPPVPPSFQPIAGVVGVYELPKDGAAGDYGWVGYVLPSDPTSQPASIATADAFGTINGHYLFARARPAAAAVQGFAASVRNFVAANMTGGPQRRGVIWLQDPSLASPLPSPSVAKQYSFGFQPVRSGSLTFYQVTTNFSAWLGPNTGFTFFVNPPASVDWYDAAQALTLSGTTDFQYNGAGIPLAVQRTAVPSMGKLSALIPLGGAYAGCFTMTALMTPSAAFPALKPGFQYWVAGPKGDVPFTFPAFDPTGNSSPQALTLAGAIDPVDLLNGYISLAPPQQGQLRTVFAVTGLSAPLISSFRSEEGRRITLAPLVGANTGAFTGPTPLDGGFAFVCQQGPNSGPTASLASFALTLAGDFGVAVEGGSPAPTLLCGLFGTERLRFTAWEASAQVPAGSILRFQIGQAAYAPVFPFPAASMVNPEQGKVAENRLTSVYQTAGANLIGPASPAPLYLAEPDGGAYYGGTPASGAPLLGPAPPGTAVPQAATFFVPIAAYADFAPDPSWTDPSTAVSEFESQILSATRKTAFGGPSSAHRAARRLRRIERMAAPAAADAGGWTTTRQGLLAQMESAEGATDFLEVDLAQYQPRYTPPAPAPPLAPFGFVHPKEVVQEALQTSQLFVAAVNSPPFSGTDPDRPTDPPAIFDNVVDIADWEFVVDIGVGVQPTDYSNILILKYCDGTLLDWVKNPNKWTDAQDFSLLANADPAISYTGLSAWLAAYLQDAIDKANGVGTVKPNPLYANIAAIATQTDWKGFLALKASLPPASALPPQIEGLAAGIDPKHFYAHHFGATLSRVKPNGDTNAAQNLVIDGVSSLFGLIDYQDPLYVAALAAGSDPDTPLMIDATDPYAFRVLNLQALFVNARMTSFQSRIQITLNQMFGAAVKTTQRADPANPGRWLLQPANGVVLDGSAVNQNGTTTYVFQQSKPTLFTFDTPALNAITVSRVQFNTLGVAPYDWPSGSAPTITSRFLFWGAFDFPIVKGSDSSGYDILSFGSAALQPLGQGLAYSNLQLTMRSPQATPTVTDFQFDPSNLAFDIGASTLRGDSLFGSLALQLQSFIYAPAGKTPLDYGFLTVAPEGLDIAALSGGWCGIVHKINMGGPGALMSAAGFSSQLLVAWSPVPGAQPALFVGLSLPGTAPGASVFSLQGVFKITTGPISLQQATAGQFTIKLANVGATFLGVKKFPDATIQFFLFGDPQGQGSIGWYASWNEGNNKKTPAKPKLVALGGTER